MYGVPSICLNQANSFWFLAEEKILAAFTECYDGFVDLSLCFLFVNNYGMRFTKGQYFRNSSGGEKLQKNKNLLNKKTEIGK